MAQTFVNIGKKQSQEKGCLVKGPDPGEFQECLPAGASLPVGHAYFLDPDKVFLPGSRIETFRLQLEQSLLQPSQSAGFLPDLRKYR